LQVPQGRRYDGFGDGFTRAVELVVTPLLLGFLGHHLDGWLGSGPVLTIVLGAWGLGAMVLLTYYSYMHQMKAEEEKLLGPRPGRAT
jgi:F0F1-type ATP synthase assembly protein I